METKTVQGTFGPKQVTKEQFVKIWTNHAADLTYLAETPDDYVEIRAMQARIKELAEKSWDKIK